MDRIIVAFERRSNCEKLQKLAESSAGFSCLVCRNGSQVRHLASKLRPCIVVCGFKLIDESCEAIFYDLPASCSMLMLAPPAVLELCGSEEIFKLSTPLRRSEILSSLRMLAGLSRGREPEPGLSTEAEQDLVAAAKALLMERFLMTEAQAHRLLQKRSMNSGVRLVQTAGAVVDSLL